jgi:hypothetical protein
MKDVSCTKQPNLGSKLQITGTPEVKALVKEVAELHGAAMVVQDQSGRMVPVRVNTVHLQMEAYIDGAWVHLR